MCCSSFSHLFLYHRLFHGKIHGFPFFTSQLKFVLPYRVIEPIMGGDAGDISLDLQFLFSTKNLHFFQQIQHWLLLPANVPEKRFTLHLKKKSQKIISNGFIAILFSSNSAGSTFIISTQREALHTNPASTLIFANVSFSSHHHPIFS